MGYELVSDFKFGMDRRRPRFAGIPGTLWEGRNVHLSRGGDIERAKKFAPFIEDLDDTFGLANVDGALYTFGSLDLAGSLPAGVKYQRLQSPTSSDMTRVLDAKTFDNKLYVIAEYEDGGRYHFYNGTRVTTWDTLADSLSNAVVRSRALALKVGLHPDVDAVPDGSDIVVTASVPGVGFSISAAATDGGGTADETATVTTVQANIAAVSETRATASFSVTSGSFDPNVNTVSAVLAGPSVSALVNLLPGPVSWSASLSGTAALVAAAINEGTDGHGYTAAALGATVTISAIEGLGAAVNGYLLSATVTGNVMVSASAGFSGGVDAVAAQTQIERVEFGGTFEALDTVAITISGTEYIVSGRAAGTGSVAYVEHNRVWSVAGAAIVYCQLNDPTDWTDATPVTGAGRIIVSTDSSGAQTLTGIEAYQNATAVFAENAVLTYQFSADPTTFERLQKLENTGTLAGRAAIGYGATDLFYLDQTGIRSLQARDSSNAAFVSDAGTAFDTFVQSVVASLPEQAVQDAVSLIEPGTGAYWLAIGNTVLVLTNYPGTGIKGWTYYSLPFSVEGATVFRKRVYVRSADTVYLYGGVSGSEYPDADEMVAYVALPFMTARDDAGIKDYIGIDIGAVGKWGITGRPDPQNPDTSIDLGRFVGVTYADEQANVDTISSHLALEFECSSAGFASLSSVALHHTGKLRR